MISARHALGALALAVLLIVGTAWAQQFQQIAQAFDTDPGWEAKGNKEAPQNFGWSKTKFAGGKLGAGEGELGGLFARATLGYYAMLEIRPGTPTLAVGVWDELSGLESFVRRTVDARPEAQRERGR